MSFSRFRESGEFSDITVIVDDTEFCLHRFPLLAKSDYFCQRVRELNGGTGSLPQCLEIKSFPGSSDVFGLVADFCYGIKISFSADNIIQLRVAAEFLQMFGSDGLADISDKFLENMIKSAKMSRSATAIVKLLENCYDMGPLAEKAELVDQCIGALATCYVQPPTKFSSPIGKKTGDIYDEKIVQQLYNLPLKWFAKLVAQVKEKGIQANGLIDLIIPFIKQAVDSDIIEKSEHEDLKNAQKQRNKTLPTRECDLIRDTKFVIPKKEGMSLRAMAIIALLPELPPEAFDHEFFTVDHVVDIFGELVSYDLEESQKVLLSVTCLMLQRLTSAEIASILPDLMFDIITTTFNADKNQGYKLGKFLDIYLMEKKQQKCLRTETFKLLITSIPTIYQQNYDNLLEILETLVQAEYDSLSECERETLLDAIDWSLISEEALERALDRNIIPTKYIAKAALSLCKKLRSTVEVWQEKNSMKDEERQRAELETGDEMASITPRSSFSLSPTLTEKDFDEADSLKQPFRNSPSVVGSSSVYLPAQIESTIATSTTNYTFRALNFDDSSLEEDLDFKMEQSFRNLDQRLKSQNSSTTNSIYNFKPYPLYTRRY